ncbi:Mbeg1-like protein [Enterococcus hirae]|uniref:Mbeg1-like protein n=2 Tax=Enterococcus hirae TaxID=1354 RepID=UPI001E48B42A|nr:hypothetical protein [Enterococcus hirae]MDT2652414.1 hypothetical protein [Enterococcus hirae]
MSMTDEERIKMISQSYMNLEVNKKISVNRQTYGYVSKIIDNKKSGEKSFIITDGNPKVQKPKEVKQITILYQGSIGINKILVNPGDVWRDWGVNNLPTAVQVINAGGATAMPQLKTAAHTLQETMQMYPNAKVSVYGHSLGSMNGQYAISDLPTAFHDRLEGVYLYQGPNIYSILNPRQQATADKLTNEGKIFNFIDTRDLVPIGYSLTKKQVGTVIEVTSKKVKLGKQHMLGGYLFDQDGNLVTQSKGIIQLAKHQTNKELDRLAEIHHQFSHSCKGISSSQEIFLDAMQARTITLGYKQAIQSEIDTVVKWLNKEIEQANLLWSQTKRDTNRWGEHLNDTEKMAILAENQVTEYTLVRQPVATYEQQLNLLQKVQYELDTLLKQIVTTIEEQVRTDKTLSQYLS